MSSGKKTFLLIVGLIILSVAYASLYTVHEGQQALLLRLGKMVRDKAGQPQVMSPGLHRKTPFIEQARYFDIRLQTLDAQSSRVLTKEQKYVLVDYYVKWKIANVSLYFMRTGGDAQRTETLLQQKINDALRTAFGKRTITEVVSGERGSVMDLLQQRAATDAQDLGIQVIDVRIKRIDLPEEVSSSVFDRMRVEREQAAAKHRADGKAQAEAIKAQADATATVIVAQAKKKAATIKATGSAEAARIYADAYRKDADFYAFYRSLQVYQNVFNNKNDVIVLQPGSQFFKYFNGVFGKQ